MDREAWCVAVHEVTKSRRRLSDRTELLYNGYLCIKASQVALVVKDLPANTGDIRDRGLISELGRSPGAGHSNSLSNLPGESH